MKKFLLLFILTFSSYAGFAQEHILKGKVMVDSLEAPMHIINISSRIGTVTSDKGDFSIKVNQGDTLMVSSVQYEKREIRITPQILQKGFLKVQVAENINSLDEVRVTSLTGNLSADLDKIKVVDNPMIRIEIPPAWPEKKVNNLALNESQGQVPGGVDILGLVGLLVGNSNLGSLELIKAKEPGLTRRKAYEKLRERFDNSFFTDHLHIELAYINDFIDYTYENGLTPGLFDNQRALDLIAFLEEQSLKFLDETGKKS